MSDPTRTFLSSMLGSGLIRRSQQQARRWPRMSEVRSDRGGAYLRTGHECARIRDDSALHRWPCAENEGGNPKAERGFPQRTFVSSRGSTASVEVTGESGGAALRQVPRIEPMMISGNPMARPTVMGSSRMRAPRRMATTGLM